jgi:hypothetical protein
MKSMQMAFPEAAAAGMPASTATAIFERPDPLLMGRTIWYPESVLVDA